MTWKAQSVEQKDIEVGVLEAVAELLEAMDAEFEEELSAEVTLVEDLEFSSIDFVQLIVAIEEKLGQKIGFQDLLMQNGKYVDDLSIGQVIDFATSRLTNPQAALAAVAAASPAIPSPAEPSRPKITDADVGRFLELIKPRQLPAPPSGTRKNPRAVFILSPPRSGSTLLRVMVAGNPALFAPPELHLLAYANMAERKADLSGERGDQLAEGVLRALMETRGWTAEQARERLNQAEAEGASVGTIYAELQQNLGDRLLVDKTPTYAYSLDILRQAEALFEDPLYIHLLRHPCGMIRSYEESDLTRMMPLLMKGSDFSSAALAEMIWLVSNRNILQFGQQIPAQRWFSLSYENVVSDPGTQMQELCSFLGVPFHEDMLNPYSDKKARMTDGVDSSSKMSGDLKFHLHSQIDPAAATRWQQFCSESMLGDATTDLMQSLDQSVARIRV